MADQQNSFVAATPRITSFSGLPPADDETFLPRARVTYTESFTVPVKGAGDTAYNRLTITLPANFAYVLDYFDLVQVSGSGVPSEIDLWDNLGHISWQYTDPVQVNDAYTQIESKGATRFLSAQREAKFYSPVNPIRDIIFNQTGEGPALLAYTYDQSTTQQTVNGNLYLHATFLAYDISQVLNVGANAPFPVSVR